MSRIIDDLNAIEFDEFYITMAKYTDTGWHVDKIFVDKVDAAGRIKTLTSSEFNSDEVVIRVISGLKKRDIEFDDMKDTTWFKESD